VEYPEKIVTEIDDLRDRLGDRLDESYVNGMKRALELFMGTAEARQFLTDNGEDSN
jgi:hypothetical protein